MNDAILLEARGLSKSFDHEGQRIDVLQRIDLVLRPGERVAIIGSSGAGKSTLLHVLGTLDRGLRSETERQLGVGLNLVLRTVERLGDDAVRLSTTGDASRMSCQTLI